jgi:transcriptional regulator with XRE-family HTH domain
MKDYESLGRALADLRIHQALTQNDLGSLLGCTRSAVAAWESGKTPPTREVILQIGELVGINTQDVNFLLSLAGYEPLDNEYNNFKNAIHPENGQQLIDRALNPEAVKEIQVQVKDIQASIEALGSRIEHRVTVNEDKEASALFEELHNAKEALKRLRTTSREITAPVALPSSADLTVKLVPSTVLERLEEYRSEESKWLSVSGIFIGSILGIFINVATGGAMSTQAWIILGVLLLMASFSGWTARSYSRRAGSLKKQLFFVNKLTSEDGFP